MARFMAVHTLPVTEEQLMPVANDMIGKLTKGVVWKQTYCGFADHKFFCEWDVPNKEALEQYFKVINMPVEAIYPVKLFDVASRKLS